VIGGIGGLDGREDGGIGVIVKAFAGGRRVELAWYRVLPSSIFGQPSFSFCMRFLFCRPIKAYDPKSRFVSPPCKGLMKVRPIEERRTAGAKLQQKHYTAFFITNNLPLVASLLASSPISTLFAIRFANRKNKN